MSGNSSVDHHIRVAYTSLSDVPQTEIRELKEKLHDSDNVHITKKSK